MAWIPDNLGGLCHPQKRSQAGARRGVLRESFGRQRRDDSRWRGRGDHS